MRSIGGVAQIVEEDWMSEGARPGERRRTQNERSQESTRRMLDAATELIADQGFTRTTIPQIAKKAGYSHGLVNQRFGSKSKMIRILAAEFQNYFTIERLTPALGTSAGLDALIITMESYIDAISQSGSLGRAYYELFGESIALVPEIHEIFVRADRDLRALLEDTIRSSIDSGEVPLDVDARSLASLVSAIMRGVSMQWALNSKSLDVIGVKREIRRLFESAFAKPAVERA
jgi:AcrR family transcriptional regulator